MRDKIPQDATGRWLVTTEGSQYFVNLTHSLVTRKGATRLRKDGNPLKLLEIYCELGRPMELLLQIREDGVRTARVTTNVTKIELLPDVDLN